jgi:hypothetical protein
VPARTKKPRKQAPEAPPGRAANKTKTRKCGRAARTARSCARKKSVRKQAQAPCGRRWCLIPLSAGQSHTSSNGFQRRFLLCRFNLRGSTAPRATLLYDARPGFATPLGTVRRPPQSGPVRPLPDGAAAPLSPHCFSVYHRHLGCPAHPCVISAPVLQRLQRDIFARTRICSATCSGFSAQSCSCPFSR